MPVAHREFWGSKINRNRERDRETDELLEAAVWVVIRVWEHETAAEAVTRIESAVQVRRGVPRKGRANH